MESIKTITIKDLTYLIQATVDDKGNVISETYITKDELGDINTILDNINGEVI